MGLYEPDFAQLAMAACPALKKGLPALGSEAAQQAGVGRYPKASIIPQMRRSLWRCSHSVLSDKCSSDYATRHRVAPALKKLHKTRGYRKLLDVNAIKGIATQRLPSRQPGADSHNACSQSPLSITRYGA